jgi:hypothetical protein
VACSGANRSAGFCAKHTTVELDNKSTIALIKNLVLHGQSKDIKVKYHLVRECTKNGRIKMEFIRSEEQLGDILTKSLAESNF